MRVTLIILTIFLKSALALAQEADFKFEDKNIRLPKTPQGKVVKFEFPFTNSGDAPLVINDIKVACPCTKFTYPTEPIPPGGKGTIKVTFETKEAIGYQDRRLKIYSNAKKSPEEVRFRIVVDDKHPYKKE